MTVPSDKPSNRSLMLPYGVPYFAYVGIAALGQDRISDELGYLLKIVIVPLLLFWGWKWYVPVTGPKNASGSVLMGVIFGLLGLFVWCGLMAPFIDLAGDPWSGTAFLLRLFSTALIVPVFEEFFIRGYIFRVAYQWWEKKQGAGKDSALAEALDQSCIDDVRPGAWSGMAVLVSTVAFTAGHLAVEWPSAVAYSLLMSVLWIIRKDLLSCMVAHGVTNLGLALYVYYSGHWGFW